MDTTSDNAPLKILELASLNERKYGNNSNLSEFDILRNCIPSIAGSLTRMNGIKYLTELTGEQVIGFCQSNNSLGKIYVQTTTALYEFTTPEFWNQTPYVPVLTPTTFNEEETMPIALIVHTATSGTSGGTMANNTNFQQAPLTSIVSQLNADGTAASFASLTANQVTLAAGQYRIEGWSKGTVAALTTKLRARLFNITDSVAAWAGAVNENSDDGIPLVAAKNLKMEFYGNLSLAGPKVFEIQNKAFTGTTTSTFGAAYTDGSLEVYRFLKIIQTSP